jgi:hypothetical protein
MVSHASVPTIDKKNEDTLRIYFSPRDKQNRSYITFIDVDINNPKRMKYLHNKPVLKYGKIGCFDDSGTMPSCIINYKGKKYLYYVGWNTSKTVPYRNSIGLVISTDDGITFKRRFEGPILDRSPYDPYFVATPFVIIEKNIWKMWYLSATTWKKYEDRIEPIYNIKYAESEDGINWVKDNITCINYKNETEAISRPCVIKENDLYKMWYSFRGSLDYRTKKENSYRIGYAESENGKKWERKDDLAHEYKILILLWKRFW